MHRFLSVLCILATPLLLHAQSRAKFEPPDGRVIHGMGQYVAYLYSDSENWQLVNEYLNAVGEVPTAYAAYVYIDPLLDQLDTTDLTDIVTNHQYPYAMLVGLTLFDASYLTTGNANIPVQAILRGDFDNRIIAIADEIASLGVPVFLRPGYEFGENNSGIHEDPDVDGQDFINMWLHIYAIFQQRNVDNVAWVWSTVNPDDFNYMEWYPGDAYVDWWGVNYFTDGQISSSAGFNADAAAHDKPVFICESCPINGGGTTNADNWNDWFVPYFDAIRNTPNLKAFMYLHDPWDRGPFTGWDDSRINRNATILNNYIAELQNPVYIHMDEYLANPDLLWNDGSGDTTPPGPVSNFTAAGGSGVVSLSWTAPGDGDLAGVRVMRSTNGYPAGPDDGTLVYEGANSSATDGNVANGTTYFYAAFAFDGVPNFSTAAQDTAVPRTLTGIADDGLVPDRLTMSVFPNPFNATAVVRFGLPEAQTVSIALFDALGRRVHTVVDHEFFGYGQHSIPLRADALSSGVYLVRIQGEHREMVRQITLLK